MNTRKPTKKEVPDDVKCWHWYATNGYWKWAAYRAEAVRRSWRSGDFWLPFDAIPLPPQTKTTKGRKA